jgi:asparagine synthase (glutamine-hydrolysing)
LQPGSKNAAHLERKITCSCHEVYKPIHNEEEANVFLRHKYEGYRTNFESENKLSPAVTTLNKLLAIDYQTFLVDNNLVKVDRATMSVSLEGREPMLDHRIIEFVAQLPAHLKIRNQTNKYILKQIVHKYIPQTLMERPKMPFIAPLTVWFKDELKEKINYYLSEEKLNETGLFNNRPVIKLRNDYLEGKRVTYQKVWNILVFQLWYERWIKNAA